MIKMHIVLQLTVNSTKRKLFMPLSLFKLKGLSMKQLIFLSAILIIFLTLSVWGASRIWLNVPDVELSFHGYLAMALGGFFSLLLGGGLMALLFFSSRKGFDEQVFSADDKD